MNLSLRILIALVAVFLIGWGACWGVRAYRHREAMYASVQVWTLTDRGHRSAYTTTWYSCHRVGRSGSIMIPHTVHHPERWWTVWTGTDCEGATRVREYDVDQQAWHEAKIGDQRQVLHEVEAK